MTTRQLILCAALCLAVSGLAADDRSFETKIARVNDVQLQYIEKGEGPAVIFIHGGLDDLRYWDGQIDPFAQHFRVIAYSRRYNYPNNNPLAEGAKHSAFVEAEDLAGLMREKGIASAHLVGASYGAYTALIVAMKHPDLVQTLVLAEAPVFSALPATDAGSHASSDFRARLWTPVGEALTAGNEEEALRTTLDFFVGEGAYENFPEEAKKYYLSNMKEWRALTANPDSLSAVTLDEIQTVKHPVLMLSGEDTLELHKLIDAQLETLLPNAQRVVIPDASHDMWNENPGKCREATLQFLQRHSGGS